LNRTLCTLIAVAGTLAIAGCGSSSSSSSSSSAPAAGSTSTAAASSSAAAGTSSASGGTVNPALAQAVTACKAAIASQSTIPSSFKAKLDHICDVAGTGNQAAIKQATHQVCIEIIKTKVPASEQQAAEASCPAA
jgi:ABC-type phosphate transport system substrate-binding protein